jgi:hypothetical protein
MTRALCDAGGIDTRIDQGERLSLDQIGVDRPDRIRGRHLDAANGNAL